MIKFVRPAWFPYSRNVPAIACDIHAPGIAGILSFNGNAFLRQRRQLFHRQARHGKSNTILIQVIILVTQTNSVKTNVNFSSAQNVYI